MERGFRARGGPFQTSAGEEIVDLRCTKLLGEDNAGDGPSLGLGIGVRSHLNSSRGVAGVLRRHKPAELTNRCPLMGSWATTVRARADSPSKLVLMSTGKVASSMRNEEGNGKGHAVPRAFLMTAMEISKLAMLHQSSRCPMRARLVTKGHRDNG